MTEVMGTGATGLTVALYLLYLAISVGVTIWVARVLHKNGRVFLVDAFKGNTQLADSVNSLLVVGFYLINIGYVALALRVGTRPTDLAQVLPCHTKFASVRILCCAVLVDSSMRSAYADSTWSASSPKESLRRPA